ncbi:MAG: cysteine dioxygenase family protein [Ramlibacter sp.]|nr:cysteine dioxygenase family protein [Ramlibacter sp.]
MNTDTYSIPQLVTDLKNACAHATDEREIISAVRPLARRAARSKASWLQDRMYGVQADPGIGVYLLHEEPDHTLAILAVSWYPHRGAPPHDHGTWAVVAGVDGAEKNHFFERTDDRSRPGHAELRKVGEKVFQAGDVVAMPKGVIHSVSNETDVVTVSLHIYGKHVNYTSRSQYDLQRKAQLPFILDVRA